MNNDIQIAKTGNNLPQPNKPIQANLKWNFE